MADQKKGSGSKKHGRNKVKCAAYKAFGRREKNKKRHILAYFKEVVRKHLKRGKKLSDKGLREMTKNPIGATLKPILQPIIA